jgi:hypothetical protein
MSAANPGTAAAASKAVRGAAAPGSRGPCEQDLGQALPVLDPDEGDDEDRSGRVLPMNAASQPKNNSARPRALLRKCDEGFML